MRAEIISGPTFVDEALFGIGLSYGLTSGMTCNAAFRKSPTYKQLEQVSRKLCHMQGGHNKFLETVTMTLDITAPRYWWQEFDTYRVGITKQSESTMHTIMARELIDEDFEGGTFDHILEELNAIRRDYFIAEDTHDEAEKKRCFMDMKNALPEGFLQRRIVCLNLKALQNMYMQRKNHRLPEWRQFFKGIAADLAAVSPYTDNVLWWTFGWIYNPETNTIEIPETKEVEILNEKEGE